MNDMPAFDGGGGGADLMGTLSLPLSRWRATFADRHPQRRSVPLRTFSATPGDDGEEDDEEDTEADDPLDDAERLLQQQTLVMKQATASIDVLPMITYAVTYAAATALATIYLLKITDQTTLLIVGALEVFFLLQGLYSVILHFGLKGAIRASDDEDNDLDLDTRLAIASEDERERLHQGMGRQTQNFLFLLNVLKIIVILVVVTLTIALLVSLLGSGLPPPELQPYAVMIGAMLVLEVYLVVIFCSHASIGLVTRSSAFLAVGETTSKLD